MRAAPILAVALFSGCGTTLDLGGSDLPLGDIEVAFVQEKTYDIDSNFDGTTDRTVHGIGIVLTDRADLCAAPGANLLNVGDAVGVQISVLSVGPIEAVETTASLTTMLGLPADGDGFVGITALDSSGGEVAYRAATENVVDPSSTSGASFELSGRSDDGAVSGSFEGTLAALLSPGAAFDTDVNGDGTMDYEAISEAISGAIDAASPCAGLDVLP